MSAITVTIASVPDGDGVVAELWVGNEQLGEVVTSAGDAMRIELFPFPGGTWKLSLDDLLAALSAARERLGRR